MKPNLIKTSQELFKKHRGLAISVLALFGLTTAILLNDSRPDIDLSDSGPDVGLQENLPPPFLSPQRIELDNKYQAWSALGDMYTMVGALYQNAKESGDPEAIQQNRTIFEGVKRTYIGTTKSVLAAFISYCSTNPDPPACDENNLPWPLGTDTGSAIANLRIELRILEAGESKEETAPPPESKPHPVPDRKAIPL